MTEVTGQSKNIINKQKFKLNMKKILIALLFFVTMIIKAQTNYSISKPLKLNTVNQGKPNDSVLVWSEDKIVKFVPKSSFSSGSSAHITAGNNVTIDGSGDINNPYVINSSYPTNGASYSDNPFTAYCFIYPDRGFQYYKRQSSSNEGRSAQATYSDSSINYSLEGDAIWPESNNTGLELKFPKPITTNYLSYTLPISVNGNFADINGNIVVSQNAVTPTLQSLINTGNSVTNPEGDNLKLLQNDGGGSINRKLIDMTTNGVGLNINNTNIGIYNRSSGNYQYGMLLADSEGAQGMAQLNAIKYSQGCAISFNNQEGAIGIYGTTASSRPMIELAKSAKGQGIYIHSTSISAPLVISKASSGGYSPSSNIFSINSTGSLQVNFSDVIAPASSTEKGVEGEVRITRTHIYVCTATNTWVRSALSAW